MKLEPKVYIVQKADGVVIAVKLSFGPAHDLAKKHAPAAVLFGRADKTLDLNVVAYVGNHEK
jgi:hypothetical protein